MNTRWLFIFHQTPVEGGLTEEALDLLLVAASFELELQVLFVGDGVWHLTKPDSFAAAFPESKPPSYIKTFKALPDFELDDLFVLQTSLCERQLKSTELGVAAEVIDTNALRSLLQLADKVFHF
ncbi:MAG: DsrE family protein [Arenicella sp.]